jgi:hypothetical protein
MNFTLKPIIDNRSPMRVCVVDNLGGSYLPIALHLSKHFQKVYFHSVSQSAFPKLATSKVGTGYSQITVLESFWDHLDSFDIIVFTDLYFSDWGFQLRKMGKLVWGGSPSDVLETNRRLFKNELNNCGMAVAPTKYIKGLSALKLYLRDQKDKWIKVSYFRGEMETTKHTNYHQNALLFDDLTYHMGPLAEELNFLVEDSIPSIAELGTDGWCIDGKMTNGMIWGLEVKDSCYIGKTTTYKDVPSCLNEVNNLFAPVLAKYKHRGFYSTEVRVGEDGKNYYTDICARAGSPPSNTYMNLISNWADIIIEGCQGKLVEPKFIAKYGVEIILKSGSVVENFLPLFYDPKYEANINLKGAFKLNGATYIIPFKYAGYALTEFGSVVVVGDNLENIMTQALTIAKSIEGPDVTYDAQALENGMETLKRVESALTILF